MTTIKWDHNQPILAFTANTADLSSEKIESEAEKAGMEVQFSFLVHLKRSILRVYDIKVNQRPVEVKIVQISWLNDQIPNLYKYLANQENASIFDNELIKVILQK